MDRATEYLRLLQEKNRLKRLMQTKSKEEQMKEELEKGFTTHFRGAHATKDVPNKVQAQVSAQVKPINILGRLTSSSRFGWGGSRKQDVVDPEEEEPFNDGVVQRPVEQSQSDEGVENEEYQSDFEQFSDSEPHKDEAKRKDKPIRSLEPVQEDMPGDDHFESAISDVGSMSRNRDNFSAPPVSTATDPLAGTARLDASLQLRVQNLSAAQKLKLMQLLQHDSDVSDTLSPVGASAEPASLGSVGAGKASLLLRRTGDSASPARASPPRREVAPYGNEEDKGASVTAAAVLDSHPSHPSGPLTVRVRITSSWSSRARFVSLGAVRLRWTDTATGERKDLMGGWTCRLMSGLQPMSASSEAVRALDSLLGPRTSGSVRPASAYRPGAAAPWKAPFAANSTVELIMEGALPAEISAHSVELVIWNCGSPPLNSGAARDVDVFAEGRCVWSGQLPEGEAVAGTAGGLAHHLDEGVALIVRPFAAESQSARENGGAEPIAVTASPKRAVPDMTVGSPQHIAASHSSQQLAGRSPAKPEWFRDITLRTSATHLLQQQDHAENEYPVYSSHVGSSRADKEVDNQFSRRRRAGAADAVDVEDQRHVQTGSPKKSIRAPRRPRPGSTTEGPSLADGAGDRAGEDSEARHQDEINPQTPPARTARRRASRRDRDSGGKAIESDTANGFAGERSADRVKEREAELKKSLDSLAFNDKFNLGRLSTSKLPTINGTAHREAVLEEQEGNDGVEEGLEGLGEESMEFSTAGHGQFVDDSLNAPGTPLRVAGPAGEAAAANSPSKAGGRHSLRSSPSRVSPSRPGGGSLKTSAAAKPSPGAAEGALTSRTARIDRVQETINSTIAGLAHIMQGISAPATSVSGRSKELPISVAASGEGIDGGKASKAVPLGTVLTFEVLSCWGDAHYVGLNGIELYDSSGHLFAIPSAICPASAKGNIVAIEACPADLNVLPDSKGDPRRVSNLLDGVNLTKSDLHSWLAPQWPFLLLHHPEVCATAPSAPPDGCLAVVQVKFDRPVRPAMCRVFNYNRSRARNQRGARWCRILLDGALLWEGEVMKASGQLVAEASESQVLFLDMALSPAQREQLRGCLLKSACSAEGVEGEGEESMDLEQSWAEMSTSRPKTSQGISRPPRGLSMEEPHVAETGGPQSPARPGAGPAEQPELEQEQAHSELDAAPYQSPPGPVYIELDLPHFVALPAAGAAQVQTAAPSKQLMAEGEVKRTVAVLSCRVLRVDIDSTWGDASYVGLSGIEILVGPGAVPVKLSATQLTARPKDLSDVGCFDDPRVLGNLVAAMNNTADDTKMWLIPFTKGSEHFLQVDLLRAQEVAGLRIWNYNKAGEHVLRGARNIRLSADGRMLFRCVLRPAPGCDGVRYHQDLLFSDLLDLRGQPSERRGFAGTMSAPAARVRPAAYLTPAVRQDYEVPLLPTGMLWRFTLFDNHNDQYFVGLDAVEFFDPDGRLIDCAGLGALVDAVPHSVRDVQPSQRDPRVPEQLLLGAGAGEGCGWLAPLARCMTPLERANCVHRLMPQGTNLASSAITSSSSAFSFPVNNVLLVMFPQPVTVAAVRIYNYSKNPSRGARDFLLDMDGQYLYMGSLLRADREKPLPQPVRGGATTGRSSRGQSVLFSNDARITQLHKETVNYCGAGEQDLLCINERQVMVRSKTMYDTEPPNTSLEGVQSDLQKRPTTSFFSGGASGGQGHGHRSALR